MSAPRLTCPRTFSLSATTCSSGMQMLAMETESYTDRGMPTAGTALASQDAMGPSFCLERGYDKGGLGRNRVAGWGSRRCWKGRLCFLGPGTAHSPPADLWAWL